MNNIINNKDNLFVAYGKGITIYQSGNCLNTHAKNLESPYNNVVPIGTPEDGFSLHELKEKLFNNYNHNTNNMLWVFAHAVDDPKSEYSLKINDKDKVDVSDIFTSISNGISGEPIEIFWVPCFGQRVHRYINYLPNDSKIVTLSHETQDSYSNGLCHEELGNYLKNMPIDIDLLGKLYLQMPPIDEKVVTIIIKKDENTALLNIAEVKYALFNEKDLEKDTINSFFKTNDDTVEKMDEFCSFPTKYRIGHSYEKFNDNLKDYVLPKGIINEAEVDSWKTGSCSVKVKNDKLYDRETNDYKVSESGLSPDNTNALDNIL
jgi:hypothetical protein